jgi:hypothetical protein
MGIGFGIAGMTAMGCLILDALDRDLPPGRSFIGTPR